MGKFISVFLVTVIWEEIEKRIAVTDEAFNDEFDLELKKTTAYNLEKMIGRRPVAKKRVRLSYVSITCRQDGIFRLRHLSSMMLLYFTAALPGNAALILGSPSWQVSLYRLNVVLCILKNEYQLWVLFRSRFLQ